MTSKTQQVKSRVEAVQEKTKADEGSFLAGCRGSGSMGLRRLIHEQHDLLVLVQLCNSKRDNLNPKHQTPEPLNPKPLNPKPKPTKPKRVLIGLLRG